jgi:thioredoxin-like negative regulator of GroEL
LSLASLVVIGIATTMIYLARDPEQSEARAALARALPPLREAVTHATTNAKLAVSSAASGAAKQVVDALPSSDPEKTAETRPLEAQAPVSARKPARNPWRSPTPRALRKLRTQIEAGQRGTDRMLAELRRYNREQPDDPRAHLLLARLFVNRGVWSEAATHYKLAFERDASSRGDPRMLKDLVTAASREASAVRSRELIPAIYGAEALPAIERARTHTRGADERARLERLARTISP